ncbi:MAG: hypothetical protein A2V67_09045 [Deltaproteobacteria bacterium RBG_13_61_14]|nr:MAG: hypothetical protein A2V67_09045 [Deltaproteobacteria bacterium RBG_13_61_14]
MEARDEGIHEYPKPLDQHWKENWYFNFIDRKNHAWGVNHVSLIRLKQQGRFSTFHVIDGEVLLYSNLIDLTDDFQELTDGKLRFEFLEPFQKFRVTFTGPRHQVEINYSARFPVFDYAQTRRPGKHKALALNHYEQALWAKGTVTKGGKTRPIECFGHRDHSWGYRNESKISAWNWAAVQFPDKTINLSRVMVGKAFMGQGFVSTSQGNTRISRVNVEDTQFQNNVPASSVFTGYDEKGKIWKLKSEKFSGLFLPMTEKGKGVVIHENFSDYTLLDTGEKGVGIDEYLINPEMGKGEE